MDITYRSDYGFIEVNPTGQLEEENFRDLARDFPGWERFSDLMAHVSFVREYDDKIGKVAICTDSSIGALMQTIGDTFVDAEVERFAYDEKDEAEKWLLA